MKTKLSSLLLLLAVLFSLSACSQPKTATPSTQETVKTQTQSNTSSSAEASISITNPTSQVAQNKEDTKLTQEQGTLAKMDTSLLYGSWVAIEDSKAELTVDEKNWTEIYNDTDSVKQTAPYLISDKCLESQTDAENRKGSYITVFDKELGPMCFSVPTLEKDKLEITYIGRGNTLSFKRK